MVLTCVERCTRTQSFICDFCLSALEKNQTKAGIQSTKLSHGTPWFPWQLWAVSINYDYLIIWVGVHPLRGVKDWVHILSEV